MLRWLGQRELTVSQVRLRLRRRHYPADVITTALSALVGKGVLDDGRAARARARHDVSIKRQGRGRVLRQVQALGVDPDTALAAVAAAFEDVDEDRLLTTPSRRLRGQPRPPSEAPAVVRMADPPGLRAGRSRPSSAAAAATSKSSELLP